MILEKASKPYSISKGPQNDYAIFNHVTKFTIATVRSMALKTLKRSSELAYLEKIILSMLSADNSQV